jgi:Pentapeptide repeats (8 copies)
MLKFTLLEIPTKNIILALGVVSLITIVVRSQPILWPGGLGIAREQSVTTKSVETIVKDTQGNITKTVETTKIDDGKTLWDWLSLLGVPVSLAILGYVLQQIQQKRSEELAKEEVLQVYFDRLSVLLVDKNLLAIAAKDNQAKAEESELLASAMDVIRGRTLSILRRFKGDPERKTSVIRFLIEADIVSKLKLNLSEADLSYADLVGADFSGADLTMADLSGADFFSANLSGAKLVGANFNFANLSHSDLAGADFSAADLVGANLALADLSGANLTTADLSGAALYDANLNGANLSGAKNLTDNQLKQQKTVPGLPVTSHR